MPEQIRDDIMYEAQQPQSTLQYPAVPAAAVGPDGVVNTQSSLYQQDVCPHDHIMTSADVEKRWINPQEPPYFVLIVATVCADCHTPFQFIHPIRGSTPDQISISQDGRQVNAPMRPRPRAIPPV